MEENKFKRHIPDDETKMDDKYNYFLRGHYADNYQVGRYWILMEITDDEYEKWHNYELKQPRPLMPQEIQFKPFCPNGMKQPILEAIG